jgi:tRNA1Val (adenine37-N6)-methyltransferase
MKEEVFRFKQFELLQHEEVFKVGTDGVLLAAWVDCSSATSILDLGTGTGLLALILAQRNPKAGIDAIDVQEEACRLSAMNFAKSPWLDRLRVFSKSFQDFSESSLAKYDLLVSNPPFFISSLRSPVNSRSISRHADTLSMADILEGSLKLLTPRGRLAIVYPCREAEVFREMAMEEGFYCNRRLFIRPLPGRAAIRTLMEFSLNPKSCEDNELVIESGKRHHYTDDFKLLTGEFYLYFLH